MPSNDSAPYSFKTSFTFSITPRTKPNSGQGLAFIIVPSADNSVASGGSFVGMLNKTNNGKAENNLFAVEFDTFQNKEYKHRGRGTQALPKAILNRIKAHKYWLWGLSSAATSLALFLLFLFLQ
ncbi:hypothetical protein Bca52824_020935 [Brassica carinata]|uniref:Legume lectin domain-containing protein n=1 Tax=Brassica carinata TaxID=52824 RepID=A0A8X8B128_BRACI|nr:hypothetical protein Bca52824_020935 [Brassica carinata]